jgi:hypothetical protein
MKKNIFSLFKRKKNDPIIVVSGLPRSGTSLMMQMLDAGGLPPLTDHERRADEDNPKGYYEFERVKALKDGDFKWVTQAQGKAVKIISALLEYLPPSQPYKVIFMRREIAEILASQHKMLVRRGESSTIDDEQMAQMYRRHLSSVEAWLAAQDHIDTLFVPYTQLLNDPAAQIQRLLTFLELPLDAQAMQAVPDKSLYRNRGEGNREGR